jgi:foldase protein PrsA
VQRLARLSLALGAFFIAAVVLAACGGNNVPGNAVANVDGTLITSQNFNHWLGVAARSQNPTGGGPVSVPDAPTFAKCVAAKKATQPKPTKGQKPPTDAQLKSQCQQEYSALRDQVMQFLISAQWIQGEAADQGVKVTDADVNKRFQQTKQQSFPKEADYQKFLKQSGMTQNDILFRVKLDALSTKIRDKVTKGQGKVTQAQITTYYNKNKKRFAQPERRDMRIVLTKTKSQAEAAKKALNDFVKDFQKKWKDRTNCRKGYITQDCSNAPTPKKTQTAVPQQPQTPQGAAPQGGAQAAPQGGAGAAPQSGTPQTAAPPTSTGG